MTFGKARKRALLCKMEGDQRRHRLPPGERTKGSERYTGDMESRRAAAQRYREGLERFLNRARVDVKEN